MLALACGLLSVGCAFFTLHRKLRAGWKEAVPPAALSTLFVMARITLAPQTTTPLLLVCLSIFVTGYAAVFRFDKQRSWPEAVVAAALLNSILLEIFYGASGA